MTEGRGKGNKVREPRGSTKHGRRCAPKTLSGAEGSVRDAVPLGRRVGYRVQIEQLKARRRPEPVQSDVARLPSTVAAVAAPPAARVAPRRCSPAPVCLARQLVPPPDRTTTTTTGITGANRTHMYVLAA